MKFKNLFPTQGRSVFLFICFLMIVFLLFFILLFFQKEKYQQKNNNGDEDLMDVIEKFCKQHLGEEWGMDHVYRYNDKIMFATIQIQGAVIDLSVQPDSRAIIIENIKGKTSLTKRVYRF